MKKIGTLIIVVAIFVIAIIFHFGTVSSEEKSVQIKEITLKNEKRAIFLSYLEYQSLLKGKDEVKMKQEVTTILDHLQENGFNFLIAHVRSFSDAIYPSDLFPSSMTLVEKEGDELSFDLLSFFIEECHNRKIEFHAWINPYRIRSTTDGSSISIKNPCYKWLGSNHVKLIENKGIFYNPASPLVRKLILAGIEEILENYNVDGILYDDYFYPDETIDDENYRVYTEEGGTLSLSDYRLHQVNELVKATYDIVHSYGKKFGISPEGNIDNNYDKNYADTKRWMSEEGYIDYIMPQIYFGFYHERKPFYDTVREWNSFIKLDSVSLLPSLAFYKIGSEDTYALSGKDEWTNSQDIIMRQVIASRGVSRYQGFAVFRYEYLFGQKYETEEVLKEKESLQKLLDIF